jgi:DNA-binding NtrC family response regulator
MMGKANSLTRSTEIPSPPASDTRAVVEASPESGPVATTASPGLDHDWPTLSILSRRYIDQALGHTHGNKTRAADLLGIDRRTLNRILARERAKKAAAVKAAE